MKKTSKYLLSLSIALAACATFSVVASAADHERITGSFGFTSTFFCTDPIRIEGAYDEVMHTYYDQSGNAIRLAFTGTVTINYTNLTTGATYSPNSSGPGTVDLASGQTIIRGSNGAVYDQTGTLVSTNGRAVQDVNGDIISLQGRSVDVCDRLGSQAN